jgi:hypothetical protein
MRGLLIAAAAFGLMTMLVAVAGAIRPEGNPVSDLFGYTGLIIGALGMIGGFGLFVVDQLRSNP